MTDLMIYIYWQVTLWQFGSFSRFVGFAKDKTKEREMTQPEALRLADALEAEDWDWNEVAKAAAELRRLHAENNELLKDKARLDWLQKAADALETQAMTPPTLQAAYELRRLYAVNQELLEALQLIADVGDRAATEISRAAIAKVEGKT